MQQAKAGKEKAAEGKGRRERWRVVEQGGAGGQIREHFTL